MTLKTGLEDRSGHWKFQNSIERMRLPIDFLSRIISEIFNVEKYRDLEIRVKGHSRSLNVVSFDRLRVVSYECSNVTLTLRGTVFLDFGVLSIP